MAPDFPLDGYAATGTTAAPADDAVTRPVLTRRNLPLLMLQAREAVFAHFRPLLNAAGITEQQWRIIRALLENGPMEPRHIAQVCCLSSPSLAGILTRMDDLGWVNRTRFENDQRRVLVSASEAAGNLAERLAPQVEARYAELEARLGPALLVQSYSLLDALIQALPAAPTSES